MSALEKHVMSHHHDRTWEDVTSRPASTPCLNQRRALETQKRRQKRRQREDKEKIKRRTITYTELEWAADWSLYKYSCTTLITAWRGADSALKHAV